MNRTICLYCPTQIWRSDHRTIWPQTFVDHTERFCPEVYKITTDLCRIVECCLLASTCQWMPFMYVPLFRYFSGLSANGLDSSEYFHLSSVVTLGGLQLASLCLPTPLSYMIKFSAFALQFKPQDARRSKTEVQMTNQSAIK